MLKEFKAFAMKGPVIDLAVGVIIGAAFGKIVASLVGDVLMPPLGLLLGGADLSNLFITLGPETYATLAEATEAGAPVLRYGVFLNTVVEFLIVAVALFLVIRKMNQLQPKPAPPPAPATKDCPYCLSKIPEKATRCPQCTSEVVTA